MWDNIGEKIKGLAKIIAFLGIVLSVIGGIILLFIGWNQSYSGGIYIVIGFITMIVGSLISWISAWFMYGFGELIVKTNEIEKNTRNEYSSKTLLKEFIPTHRVKLITDVEGLKVRKEPVSTKEFITKISNGTEVQYLNTGAEAILNDVKAPFFEIITKDNIQGWVFSGHLEKI